MAEIRFRACLYCEVEIDPGRRDDTNFCDSTCHANFLRGMDIDKYKEACELNRMLPIRGARTPEKVRRERKSRDSIHHRICKLSEYKDPKTGALLCDVKFPTTNERKLFHSEACQVAYNDLKKLERRVMDRVRRADKNGN